MSHVNDSQTKTAVAYAQQHADQFLAEMVEFLKIPSISTRSQHDADVRRAADWLADNMRGGGLENVTIYKTDGHPLVYADWLHAKDAPTVLFYGHYDVQPADNLDLWQSPPFEPEIRDQSIFARGCSDDKGQVLILVKAVEAYLQAHGTVPVNIKFIIEGEEESGGEAIAKFLPEHKDLLKADIAYVADTAFADFNIPSIVYGLRGIAAVNIDVMGPRLDLHSGSYGGGVDNPINAIAHIIAQLKDQNGHVLVPHFYDGVRELSAAERQLIAENALEDVAGWLEWIGVSAEWGEPEFTLAERLGARPTLDVNGIIGGYTGEGGKTIIPSQVHAKIT
ncbi:MAG TPA: M20/M25/M40 family metallo-hydrolase, partial [Anaerolineae bacterium]|nr:M20/M25/M40 family metallo-hydrolase [Anaerolineae bacterium]